MVHLVTAHLFHVNLHVVEDRREDCWAPESRPLDSVAITSEKFIEAADRRIFTQTKAVHVHVVSITARLIQDEIWYSSEAISCKLLFITVWLEDLTDFHDGKFVVVTSLVKWS